MRPGEAYQLRWEHVLPNGAGGLIQIAEGKTKAARRFLPMVPKVYSTLKDRHEQQKRPTEGWVFPAGSASGHLEESSAKKYHGEALRRLEQASSAYKEWKRCGCSGDWVSVLEGQTKLSPDYLGRHRATIQVGCKKFAPYCLRHSALTMLAASGATLSRLHGSRVIVRSPSPSGTVIPKLTPSKGHLEGLRVGTILGTVQNCPQKTKADVRPQLILISIL
jgi:integrase